MSSEPAELRYSNSSGHNGLFFNNRLRYLRKKRRCLRGNALRPTILNMLSNKAWLACAALQAVFVV
jgi:hypothetical protein